MLTRRNFTGALASAAFGGLALAGCSGLGDNIQRIPGFRHRHMRRLSVYGELRPCPRFESLDLPKDFSCQIVSSLGGEMARGGAVPDKADGMGSFAIDDGRVVLVRNHELRRNGGTTTILYDCDAGKVEREYRSLTGTIRNCAGGATPWGTWLSCEEDLTLGHGFVYEVPAIEDGLVHRKPLTHLGRFNHEAAAVDPRTNVTYMTEDQIDSLFYRYVPLSPDAPLARGGKLQALIFHDPAYGTDTRNWGVEDWAIGEWRDVRWATLDDNDDPRKRAVKELGAVRFGCGEGIHFGDGELYFTCTSGGRIKSGQIMRYVPNADGETGRIQLFLEATDPRAINYADNLVVAPNGDLIVCEDPYFGGEKNYIFRDLSIGPKAPCYLRGVTPEGEVYDIARLRSGSELAGVCFSPKGDILFVNVYSPSATLAIRGPWGAPRPGWQLYRAGRAAASSSTA
jgi:hypothetical protein